MMPKKGLSRRVVIFVLASFLFSLFSPFLKNNEVFATDYDLSSSSNYDARIAGAAASDNLTAVGAMKVGDINGDGIDDLVMGAQSASNNGALSGSVWVILGGSTKSGDQLLSTPGDYNIRFSGQAGEYLGSDIAIGDVNGDGNSDLIIGAYVASNNGNAGSGSVYVLFSTFIAGLGDSTGQNLSFSTASNYNIRYDGVATDGTGNLGAQGSMLVNDVNGDGLSDLVMDASSEDNNGAGSGSVYVIFSTLVDDVGSTTGNNKILSTSTNYNIRFDGATAGDVLYSPKGGDVNGDGLGDLVLGSFFTDYNSTSNGGSAWVIFSTLIDDVGSSTGQNKSLSVASNYNIRFDGSDTSQLTYQNDIAIGDVNGDGLGDLVLGGPYADHPINNGGSAWVIFSTLIDDVGITTGNDLYLETTSNYNIRYDGHPDSSYPSNLTENGVIHIGDVNGDGLGDLVLGAPLYSIVGGSSRGDAFVFYSTLIDDVGSTTGNNKSIDDPSSYNILYYGGNSATRLTYKDSVAIGDVDNDGHGDLLLGTYTGTSNKGYLWVIYSSTIQSITGTGNQKKIDTAGNHDDQYIGAETNAFLTLNGTIKISDLNNDGGKDLILGSRGMDANGADSGAVYLFYGTPSNTVPSDPSSLGGHTNGSFINDNTPALTFTLSDPDVGDTVKYQIQIDDSSDFSSPVVDYTSALASQGSATFTVGQAAGSGSYTTGSEGQTLTDGSYYWRVKAIDASAAESSFTQANSGSIAFKVDATAPSVPTSLSITSPTTDNTPLLTWSASSDSGSGLTGTPYTVEWCTGSSFTGCGSNTDTVGVTSFTNSTALADGTWYFRVKASDAAGNTSSPSSNATVVIDSTAPSDISLDSPGGNEYTNNQRPTFKWKATSDLGGLSKYTLSVNNGDNGSFTIDNIGVSGTSSVETNKYVINYENFGDGDSTNNYISVSTKSSSDWTSNQNDGKLYEGKRSWTVTAHDSAGNTTSTSRDLYIDLTNPGLSSVNITHGISKFGVSGAVSDTKAGSKSSKSDYLRSNPESVDIEIIKNGYLLSKTIATATINLSSSCDYSDTTSDSLSCSFSKAIDANFGYGNFTVKVTGKDKAGNSVTTKNDVSIGGTLPGPRPSSYPSPTSTPTSAPGISASPTPTPTPTINFSAVGNTISNFVKNTKDKIVIIASFVFDSFSYNAKIAVNVVSKGAQVVVQNTGIAIATIADTPQKVISQVVILISKPKLTLVALGNGAKSAGQKVSQGVGVVVQNSKVVIVKIGETPQKAKIAIVNLIGKSKATLGPPTQKVTNRLWFIYSAIVPGQRTEISNIKVESVTNNSTVITWNTNHPATSKVNFGEDKTMGETVYNETPVTKHQLTLNNLKEKTDIYFEVISEGRTTAYDSFRIFTTK